MSIREMNANGVGQPNPGAGAALGKPPKLRSRHALARDWYLFKVDLHLDGGVPTRIRKRILADLRNSIDSYAGSSSLKEVLEGLGKPSELAASYAEGADQTRPLWTAGLVAAL